MSKTSHVDYRVIGTRIKLKRKAAHLTQEEFSEKIDVTVGYVSQIERGITKINLDKLAEISGVLNCDISYFVTGASADYNNYMQSELIEGFLKLTNKQKNYIIEFINVMVNINLKGE